jgi:uncharacterized protein (TIGR03083 family)
VGLDAVAAIRRESGRLAALVAAGDEDAPIAACPGWAVRDAAAHVAEVQRFWAWVVQRGTTAAPDPAEEPTLEPTRDLVSLLTGGAEALVDALQDRDPDEPCWAWWPGPCTVGQVARHQVQEVALHRWDVEVAGGGEPEPFPAEQAADGIDELLFTTFSAMAQPYEGARGVLVIDPDDADEGWTLDLTGGRPEPHRGAASMATTRLLGTASDVQLLLWSRPRTFRYRGEAALLTDLLAWPDLG